MADVAQLQKEAQEAADALAKYEKKILDDAQKTKVPGSEHGIVDPTREQKAELAKLKKVAEEKEARAKLAERAEQAAYEAQQKIVKAGEEYEAAKQAEAKAAAAKSWSNLTGAAMDQHIAEMEEKWNLEAAQTAAKPSLRPKIVAGGIISAALIALATIGLLVLGKDDGPSKTNGAPAKAGAAPAARNQPILWGNTTREVSTQPGPGCNTSFIWTMKITDGARFAGKPAIVMLFGPDYPDRPRKGFTVGADGTFEVPYEVKQCFQGGQAGVALVSVDGNTNVLPPPPS